ncbi:MAG: hypothetical protein Q7J06_00010 [Bacteroidales bacterium]|nr:hypothetical protein [Bacteroidales bacterium]
MRKKAEQEKKQICPVCKRLVCIRPLDGAFRPHKRHAEAPWCTGEPAQQGDKLGNREYRKRMKCEAEGCPNTAKYNLYRTNPDGTKTWVHVCDSCDRKIAFDNLIRAGGHINRAGEVNFEALKGSQRSDMSKQEEKKCYK